MSFVRSGAYLLVAFALLTPVECFYPCSYICGQTAGTFCNVGAGTFGENTCAACPDGQYQEFGYPDAYTSCNWCDGTTSRRRRTADTCVAWPTPPATPSPTPWYPQPTDTGSNPVQLTAGLSLGFAALGALACFMRQKRKSLAAEDGMDIYAAARASSATPKRPATSNASEHFSKLAKPACTFMGGSAGFAVHANKLRKLAKIATLLQLWAIGTFIKQVIEQSALFPGAADQTTANYFYFCPNSAEFESGCTGGVSASVAAACTAELKSFYAASAMKGETIALGIFWLIFLIVQDIKTFGGVKPGNIGPAAVWDTSPQLRKAQNADMVTFCLLAGAQAFRGYCAPISALDSCNVFVQVTPMLFDYILPIWILLLGLYSNTGSRLFHGYNIFRLDEGDDAPTIIKAYRAMHKFTGSHTFEWGSVFKKNEKCIALEDDFVVKHSLSTVSAPSSLLNLVVLVSGIYGITMTLELPEASAYTFDGKDPAGNRQSTQYCASELANYYANHDPYTTAAHQKHTFIAGCVFVAMLVLSDLYALAVGRSMPYLGFTDKAGTTRKKYFTWLLAGIAALIFTVRSFRSFNTGYCNAHPKIWNIGQGFYLNGMLYLQVKLHAIAPFDRTLATDPPCLYALLW
jgi:hypothetical protein